MDILNMILMSLGLISASISTTFLFCWLFYRDHTATFYQFIRLLLTAAYFNSISSFSFADAWEEMVDSSPSSIQMILGETGEERTRLQMDEIANRVGYWIHDQDIQPKDTIALMLLNSLDYVSIWLGVAKAGGATSLLNNNIFGQAFLHCADTSLKSSSIKILIVDEELKDKLQSELAALSHNGVKIFYWGSGEECVNNKILPSYPTNRPPKRFRAKTKARDPLVYIFTSGTTGLPKACKISQVRFTLIGSLFKIFAALTSSDRAYTVMPLYHSAAGIIGVGGTMLAGSTMVIRKRFSVRAFSSDCVKYKITVMQYIGEICRFLVKAEPNPVDNQVKIRAAFGNGMRPDYWLEFQRRYNVGKVVEFYGATEGSLLLVNPVGKVGALGFVPWIISPIYPVELVRVDPHDPSIPLRDPRTGLCIRCPPHEPGLALGSLNGSNYEGYTDEKATKSKLLVNVLRKNDFYFNSGDLMTHDGKGYYYWSDRVGDTFRWKGENVSTTEVMNVLSSCTEVMKDVVVYGVEVPHNDGRGGMAAIIPMTNSPNLDHIAEKVNKELPSYAKPLFLRIKKPDETLPMTTTHKYLKGDLIKQSFDPAQVGEDKLYYLDLKTNRYLPIDRSFKMDVEDGKIRF